ncbi:MAG: hypothetical protein CL943_00940 [Candidatus Diapherotrites archaeon]|uniref:Pantothenate kinase n=1 Tax=Candidatus Iainarchaeum sp. TaxID=3101447 RepID=A0A2D6M097_9ARCH|nr:hypothetical protein [Candidatus Diapherotrites archaeon]|tara:strand:+ start:59 stop:856 length:798 start_codon:yes stop_codon:yes gene_type:complete
MILGIDFGISTTDVALLENCRVKKTFFIKPGALKNLEKAIAKNNINLSTIDHIALTGDKTKQKNMFGKPIYRVPELKAIGFGGAFLSKYKNALIVSMGTGTCIVSFKNGKIKHVAGTGLGGGTIVGLSHRLVGENEASNLGSLASKGELSKTDLTVKEAIGSGIGLVPGSATASNLVKPHKVKKATLALGIQNMVAETNAVIAALAAKKEKHDKIVFIGKTCQFPMVKKVIKRVLAYYGPTPMFPKLGGSGTAIGAAAFQGNCFK